VVWGLGGGGEALEGVGGGGGLVRVEVVRGQFSVGGGERSRGVILFIRCGISEGGAKKTLKVRCDQSL